MTLFSTGESADTPSGGEQSTQQSEDPQATGIAHQGSRSQRWAIPGAHARKQRAARRMSDQFQGFFEEHKRQLDELNQAEQRRQSQENAEFYNFMREQQAAEDRRFAAMQAQQQASQQNFMQVMSTLISAVCPVQSQSQPAPNWVPMPYPSAEPPIQPPVPQHIMPRQSLPPHIPQHQQPMHPHATHATPPPVSQQMPPSSSSSDGTLSSMLHDVNRNLYNC